MYSVKNEHTARVNLEDSAKLAVFSKFVDQLSGLKEDVLEQIKKISIKFIDEGIFVLNSKQEIAFANNSALNIIGCSFTEVLGRQLDEIVKLIDNQSKQTVSIADVRRHLAKSDSDFISYSDLVMFSKNNAVKRVSLKIVPYQEKKAENEGLLLIIDDVTLLEQFEREVVQNQYLRATTNVVGGIVHDYNNILTSIVGNISLAQMYENDTEKMRIKLDAAEKACMRAKELSKQLLNYCRNGNPAHVSGSTKEIIVETAHFVNHGSKIDYKFDFKQDLFSLRIDPSQLSQIIHNIVINAIHSMENGGTIRIKGTNFFVKERNLYGLLPGTYVRISVSDEGHGIPLDIQPRVFEPFFSTKSSGTGLGLASCKRIVEDNFGYIEFASVENTGTTFDLFLPAVTDDSAAPVRQDFKYNYSGFGRVLIIDDDEDIKKVTGNMMKLLGFDIDFADNEKEIIELVKKSIDTGNRYRIALIDLTLPGEKSGIELLGKIHQIDKEVSAVLTTGYYDDKVCSQYSKYGFKAFLPKPYKITDLIRTMKELNEINNS